MCDNLKLIPDESAIVYKVVAKKPKEKRYYSIAMGFKYPEVAGKIPEVKTQRCLEFFNTNILDRGSPAYNPHMVGRTAGFVSRRNAECFAIKVDHFGGKSKIYEIIVIKAKLTDGLMSGVYTSHPVVAGKHIKWLE